MAFADNNNVLFETALKISDTSDIKFQMLENKNSGKLNANIREFIHNEKYTGPGKSGMFLKLTNKEDVQSLQKAFNEFFDKIQEYM